MTAANQPYSPPDPRGFWDSPAEATEFAAAAQTALDTLGGSHAMIAIDGTDRVTIFVATDDATITALGSALGLAG